MAEVSQRLAHYHPLYYPQGNSGVERVNQVTRQCLKAQLAGGKSMVDALECILFTEQQLTQSQENLQQS